MMNHLLHTVASCWADSGGAEDSGEEAPVALDAVLLLLLLLDMDEIEIVGVVGGIVTNVVGFPCSPYSCAALLTLW